MQSAHQTLQPEAVARRSVNRLLLAVFAGLWILTAFHLHVGMREAVWHSGWRFIVSCAAPPLLPFAWMLSMQPARMASGVGFVALVVCSWWWAIRRPQSVARVVLAVLALCCFWFFLDFGLAFAAGMYFPD